MVVARGFSQDRRKGSVLDNLPRREIKPVIGDLAGLAFFQARPWHNLVRTRRPSRDCKNTSTSFGSRGHETALHQVEAREKGRVAMNKLEKAVAKSGSLVGRRKRRQS
jgi:hypothetical protein